MDHLTFCIKVGNETAHSILMDTVNKVIANLGIDLKQVERVSICGNPIQLSLFQGIPVDDLAFAGENAKRERGIKGQKRDAGVFSAVDVELNVPAGTQPGQQLRIRGYGVKDLRSGSYGDQYVTVDITIPKKISREEKELYEQLANRTPKKESVFEKFKKSFK